ncbi:MAG: hypothetical protein HY908_05330 [Myxococcales bacterium]|nr:hypothetical protein [Myxococcales bacterium]
MAAPARTAAARLARALGRVALLAALCLAAAGCGLGAILGAVARSAAEREPPPDFLGRARLAAQGSEDAEVVGSWLVAELVAPGGDAKRARLARLRLDELGPAAGGDRACLARALDDEAHGRLAAALDGYVALLERARKSSSAAEAPLYGWYAASRMNALREAAPSAWARVESAVVRALDEPGQLGWRARDALIEWWAREELYRRQGLRGSALLERLSARQGCVRTASFAGPFARSSRAALGRRYEAEAPGPWPARFRKDPLMPSAAEVHPAIAGGCVLRPAGGATRGIHYVQTFLELHAPREVLLAVRGAVTVLVDDVEVTSREPHEWGSWVRFGVRLGLGAGRHRILARLSEPETSIRVLDAAGRPLPVGASSDDAPGYALGGPSVRPDPNVLVPALHAARGEAPPADAGTLDLGDPALRFLAAFLSHLEGQDDLAAVVLEPLSRRVDDAPGPVLALAAAVAEGDPILAPQTARDLARDLRERALGRDEEMWEPALYTALGREDRSPVDTVRALEALAERFPKVPAVVKRLAATYAKLGWQAEYDAAIQQALGAFPDDLELAAAALDAAERRGDHARADELAGRIRTLDPSAEVDLRRALARADYRGAAAELRRLGSLSPERSDLALRLADVLARAAHGRSDDVARLELALAADPTDAASRLGLADARLSRGDQGALREALVDALRAGGDVAPLERALELVEGVTEFEPYRRDGLALVRELEASGLELPGTAARVLDYAVVWVRPDGSARMLEHEIVRVQSRDAVTAHAEQKLPAGLVLHARTIKKDGTVFEPEVVGGKPTVTMPHLDVGDYIETETVWPLRSMGDGGQSFVGPRWFFREENVSYHLSEFVVVSPASRPLEVETTGDVPPPAQTTAGALEVRRWRVTASLAAPEEPFAAPAREFLPSVRVGWGLDLERYGRRLAEAVADEPPHDPRLVRAAANHARGKLEVTAEPSTGDAEAPAPSEAPSPASTRVRELYRWVLKNVSDGQERQPQRIITGRSGDRALAFVHLCRLVGIDAELGLVADRLAPPPEGPIAAAEAFGAPAVRVVTEEGPAWLLVGDPFVPFGYLPSSLRGQPALVLGPPWQAPDGAWTTTLGPPALPRETTSDLSGADGTVHEGVVRLEASGAAEIELTSRFRGGDAVFLRHLLHKEPAARHKDVLEANLLGLALPGARIRDLEVRALDDVDAPLELALTVGVPSLGRRSGGTLEFGVPFLPDLGAYASLATRQTPLYLPERQEADVAVRLRLELPPGAELDGEPAHAELAFERAQVTVADRREGRALLVDRHVVLPAMRVGSDRYAAFRTMALDAARALGQPLVVRLPP